MSAKAPKSLTTEGAIATVVGNAVEFYDFMSYAYFATYIGRAFFPSDAPLGSLLLAVATFGVGFLTRPIGGAVIGAYADRHGRKPAMTMTISLMALGSAMIAVIPSYATIGIAAPILMVTARLIQGFSVGGEVGPSTSYLLEAAPDARRGWYASWQSASQGIASLTSGVLGFTLSQLLSPDQLQSWGWRVPFALGILILPIGIYIRRRLVETLDPEQIHSSGAAVVARTFTHHSKEVTLGVLAIMGATVATYVNSYMTTYGMNTLHLATGVSMLATVTLGIVGTASGAIGGLLADRFGRRLLAIGPRVVLVLVVWPAFELVVSHPTPAIFLSVTALLSLLNGLSSSVILVQICESFPQAIRSTAMSLAYAISVTVFGGTTQFLITWVIAKTDNPISPAYYMVLTNLVSVLAMLYMPKGQEARVRTPVVAAG